MTGADYEITAAVDPAVAATLRTFVRESGRRLEVADSDVEDLTLVTTELLANAVDAGETKIHLQLSADADGWCLRAEGIGELQIDPDAAVNRSDILHGVADVDWASSTLVVRPRVAVDG